MLKFIDQGNPKGSNRVDVDIPAGRYTHLAIVIQGTADTGQSLSKDSILNARFERGGTQYQSEGFEFYSDLNNLWRGFPEFTTPDAGDQYAVMYIPFGYPTFPNTADIKDNNEATLDIQFDGALDTVFGSNSATYEVYGITDRNIPESYRLRVVQRDIQASGAGRVNDDWSGPNVGVIFARDENDVVDRLQLQVDGETKYDNIDDDFIRAVTSLENEIEASGFGLAELLILTPGLRPSTFNDQVEFEANFTGSGTLEITYLAFEWGTGGDSVQRVQSEIARKSQQFDVPARAVSRGNR